MKSSVVWWRGKCDLQKNDKKVLLKSKREGYMFTLDMKPIVDLPSICLLLKACLDISFLWHQRLSNFNFKNLNKHVLKDLVWGLHVLKFDNGSFINLVIKVNNIDKDIQLSSNLRLLSLYNCYLLIYVVAWQSSLSMGKI